jgi:uroporphyrin-III C-methyltransferase
MNTQSAVIEDTATIDVQPVSGPDPATWDAYKRWLMGVALVAVAGVVLSGLLWQRLGLIQEQLARQNASVGADATEARINAKQAQALVLETAVKVATLEARLSEVALQRSQLEELMQSLSRSRDENLVVDIESAIRLAQQQAQLTGSVEPLLAALKSAELRVTRAAQPRLTSLQRALGRDVARIKATAMADTPSLLIKLDELVLLVDDLPVANAVALALTSEPLKRKSEETILSWWTRLWHVVRDEARTLVRVSRIDTPEAALLSPEQSFFLRENLKLRLLNARLGLMSRQSESARVDLNMAATALGKYFDGASRKTQVTLSLLQQVRSQMNALEVPRVDETLSALSTAAAGR